MHKKSRELLSIIKEHNLVAFLFEGKFGLEKENVRVTKEGHLSLKEHPLTFGDKSKNPFITTDFSESQIELITPPMASIEEAYNLLDTLNNIVTLNLDNEYLWPQSLPPILPNEEDIPIAKFSKDAYDENHEYRKKLAEKYGRKKQLISGIHYNFSLNDQFIKKLYSASKSNETLQDFKNDIYLKMMRYTIKNSWLLIYLLGSSPATHPSYLNYCEKCENSASFRSGSCGYRNSVDYFLPMDHIDNYINALKKLTNKGDLIQDKEYYGVMRPKTSSGKFPNSENSSIEYLELRLLDINPLFKNGISMNDLKLIHLFLLQGLLSEDDGLPIEAFVESMNNNRHVADHGRESSVSIKVKGRVVDVREQGVAILKQLKELDELSVKSNVFYGGVISDYLEMINDRQLLYSNKVYEAIKKDGFIEIHLKKANEYLEESNTRKFNVTGYEDLELSTQILMLDAMRRGIKIKFLDRQDNFIQLQQGNHIELIKQATKTSLDNYSAVLAMESKIVTKKILSSNGIKVPDGYVFHQKEQALQLYEDLKNSKIVIKPNATNFGIGITIFTHSFSEEDYKKAIDLAFEHDQTILIESFIEGKEYRVFVMGDEVVGVLHRVPANVTGDGIKTISELVIEKNLSPLRGTGYRKPLQKINLGKEEELFLSQEHKTFDDIPQNGELIYLRENSNISTGGDSIDFTDDISESLKQVAIESANAMGVKITGVDMMIKDIKGEAKDNYSIIEVNFNPAIHIHCFPYKGSNRKLGDKLLDLLGF